MHIAALILGILGLILCWWPIVGPLGVLLALISLILSIVLLIKKDDSKKTFGIIGLVLGGIAFLGGTAIQIFWFYTGSMVMDAVDDAQLDLSAPPAQSQPFE